jgi:2-C-methyl-D-erythritol 4-phosphate cytidylyltransferase/2-C-methyl-D-erythritol 2,4-cyclodiphosphate synthase
MLRTAVVIVAGGSGNRFGSEIPKQYNLLDNKPILQWTVEQFLDHPQITDVIVVIGEGDQGRYTNCIKNHPKLHTPVIGGTTRQLSVFKGLKALETLAPTHVLVHDGARPFASHTLIDQVIEGLKSVGGCIPALPVHETVKRTTKDRVIEATIQREQLWLAQTPQGFDYQLLVKAHETFQHEDYFTDDASLFEALGLPVTICPGEVANIKITYKEDLKKIPLGAIADVRVGNGFDVHELVPGVGMMILGVMIPGSLSLKGHSDADVALHSLTDAIFGAIGDGDIGIHFPPTDMQWRGADSSKFLMYALKRMRERGGRLNHVDITLIGENPKFSPYREQFLASLETYLGIGRDRIGVKATTTEKLGFLGRGEGLAVQATATVIF